MAGKVDPCASVFTLWQMKPSDDSVQGTFTSIAAGLNSHTALNNGSGMPWMGLGVHRMGGDAETEACVRTAIELGYRSIDTAALYGNETGVGAAVRDCGLPREELFVTTKVWNDDQRADRVAEAFEESLARLGLEYVDLYLVHWPVPERFVATWKVLERIYREGRARAIGVSNFLVHHLEALMAEAEVMPAVNQIEFHPYLRSTSLLEYCRRQGIRVTAWSPLMQGRIVDEPVLRDIGHKHGKTAAQVVLRWDLQNGVVTIPKSSRRERMLENADVFDFSLDAGDMARIDALDRHQRSGADPDNFGF